MKINRKVFLLRFGSGPGYQRYAVYFHTTAPPFKVLNSRLMIKQGDQDYLGGRMDHDFYPALCTDRGPFLPERKQVQDH